MKRENWIWVVLAVAIIILFAWNWKKWFGKKNGTDTGTDTGVSIDDPQKIADDLYNDMKGIPLSPAVSIRVGTNLSTVSNSNDSGFIAVWNAFGRRDGYNLGEWAEDEWYVASELSSKIINRANMLGLN